MKICFHVNDERAGEREIAEAFRAGARCRVDLITGRTIPDQCDILAMIGVKNFDLLQAARGRGIRVVYFDKGYTRNRDFVRVAINDHQPTGYLHRVPIVDNRRAARFGWHLRPWRRRGATIVIAGSSQKYYDACAMGDATVVNRAVVDEINRKSTVRRAIIYRPKPSWKDAQPIKGTMFSRSKGGILPLLDGVHALVTHGSNACFESVLYGVPVIALGNAVAASISSTSLAEINDPRLASDIERAEWLMRLAHCQWAVSELRDGSAWKYLEGVEC